MGMNHKIHIGFNFHVNFHHADRGDTNDSAGFERDLKMVRFILAALNKANNAGQPVRAAWDFESEYTLGRILPSLGPDVIEQVKTRLRERGDELLLSGNHANLFAAMTSKEIKHAVKYILGDGESAPGDRSIKRILGDVSPILRTEGYIFSPSIIGDLRKSGIKAVLLGNSSVGPDAFTTVNSKLKSNPLTKFNPVTYRHGNDSVIMVPVYSPGDFLDEGGLTRFLTGLHEKQAQGEIENDLFVMIGADTRSAWWNDMGIKSMFRTVPGTGGFEGFLGELRKLDFVAYNTPSGYLKEHDAEAEVSFNGEVGADSGSGIGGWSENPSHRLIWTRADRARQGSRVYVRDRASDSIEKRISLLSASGFGKDNITPSKERFAVIDSLSKEVQSIERHAIIEKEMSMRTSGRQRLNNSANGKYLYSRRKDDEERNTFIIMNPDGQRTVSIQLQIETGQCPKIGTLVLECDECQIDSYTALETHNDGKFVTAAFVVMRFAEPQDTYKIYYHFDRSDLPKEEHKPLIEVKPEEIPVFHAEGAMKRLLEAQGKLNKEPAEEKDEGNAAVNERITAMNIAATKNPIPLANSPKETYIIESPSRKLKIIVSGTGVNKGKVREVFLGDERIGDDQFLSSFIKCGDNVSEFTCEKIEAPELKGQGEGIKIIGEIHGKNERTPGRYSLALIATPALKGVDGVLVYADITYPEMSDDTSLKEVAPFQITPQYRAGISILKKSFNGDISDYPVGRFAKAVPENKNLDSFNNHLTGGIIGIKGALSGIILGHARCFNGGMAICPGRLKTDEEGQIVSLNPFGTYGLRKRHYPTKSDGLIQKYADLVVNDSDKNAAASYSGVSEKFCMCISGFTGANPGENIVAEMSAFSNGGVICGDDSGVIHPFEGDNIVLPNKFYDMPLGRDEVGEPAELKQINAEISKYFTKTKK